MMRSPLSCLALATVALGLLLLLDPVQPVDRGNFKNCDQSSFCRRCRKVEPNASPYSVVAGSLNTYSDSVTANLRNADNGQEFVLKVAALKDATFHVQIAEKHPLIPRYRVLDALKGPVEPET